MSRPGVKARTAGRLLPAVLVALGWVAAASVFYRRFLFGRFTAITGDNGDTRLIIYLHEHWVQVQRGEASWRTPSFFHPTADTLGYSDTFVLDEVFYAPLRWLGADPFLAYQLTLVALSFVGYVGAYHLLRRILPEPRTVCAGLALTFTFANVFAVQAGHTQLFAVYWIPAIVLLLLRIRADPGPATGACLLAGLAVGLLFLSTFYVAWFSVLVAAVWSVTRWALGRSGPGAPPGTVRATVVRCRRRMAAAMVGAAGGGVPFLVVYLPNLGSRRSFDVVIDYAAQPRDVLNTGARNYLWGPLTRGLFGTSTRLGNGELGFGLTPVLLIALAAATAYLVRRFVVDPDGRQSLGAALATAVTCWAAIVLPMKIAGLSLWYFIWLLVPGARAIRAIDRIGVLAALLAPVVIAFVVADVRRRLGTSPLGRRWMLVSFAVVGVVVLEQFNVGRNAGLDRAAELAALQAVPDPPAGCRVFYLTGVRNPARLAYVSSIDAMLIAQSISSRGHEIATINGFSGQFPPGFGEVADPGAAGYDAAVQSWITRHHLSAGVCSYEQARRQWSVESTG